MNTILTSRSLTLAQDANLDGDSSAAKRSNVLATKLTSALSSSYTDSEIRDALRIFDQRYGQADLDADFDLKYEAQKEVIDANARIIQDFSKVAKQLNRVGSLIDSLNQTCEDIRKHVQAAKQETAPMLEEAAILLAQKRETEEKKQLLDTFCQHFLISNEDLATLTSLVEPVNDQFFQVLARAKQIYRDCELLLGYENQRLGLELMEQTTKDLNAGYKKLFSSTQRDFKGLDLENPHTSGSIRRSLRALSERPVLFQNCLESFAEARQSTLSEAFQQALTDSTMGAARAIDFSTHDPLRYMGDMLAWLHSATVSEMEALEGLFIIDASDISNGLHDGKAMDPFTVSTENDNTPFDGHAALNSLISQNMSSVAYTLNQRILISVHNLSDVVDIYKAYNVLSFYHDMFLKLIRHSTSNGSSPNDTSAGEEENTILSTISSLQAEAFVYFQTVALETLHSSIDDSPSPELTPPVALSETLATFTTITQTRGPALTLPEFGKLYGTLISPVLASCVDLAFLAGELPNATAATPTIYKLNCMTSVRNSLASLVAPQSSNSSTPNRTKIDAAAEPLRQSQDETASLETDLTKLLLQTFLDASGLSDLSDLISEMSSSAHQSARRKRKAFLKPGRSLSHDDDRDGEGDRGQDQMLFLEALARRLDTFLASALMDAQDDLSKLLDKSISASVLRKAVGVFCNEFEDVVDFLEEIDEGVEREALAKKMGKPGGIGIVNGQSGLHSEESSEDENGDDGEGNTVNSVGLRQLYPRTVEEVSALLS